MERSHAAGPQPQRATRPGPDRAFRGVQSDDLPVAGGTADAEGQRAGGDVRENAATVLLSMFLFTRAGPAPGATAGSSSSAAGGTVGQPTVAPAERQSRGTR